ncbi:MAG TPA: endonuclease/exonuclease/phosphatase family protein [Bryobacteraceae bacterium]|nr:endonuclease/exonuclease/phosphatase family protein [Bryobacteraceae bacterium]
MQHIRVATYNVHKCEGLDRRVSPLRIATVIREFKPDVIGLQEVLGDQAEWLARHLEYHFALGEVRRHNTQPYGNAILSRFPLSGVCTYDLTAPGRERRGCVRTALSLPDGQVLHLFNLHLGTAFLERRYQARRIVEAEIIASKDLPGPRIVLGDFNEWTRGLVSTMLSAELKGADIRLHLKQPRTYPGLFPLLHLDHIYYDEDLVVERVILHRTPRSLLASDHVPLIADFRVLPPTGRRSRTVAADSRALSEKPHSDPADEVPASP